MPAERASANLIQELKQLLCSVPAPCFMSFEQSEDFAAALRKRIVDMVHGEILEMPWFATRKLYRSFDQAWADVQQDRHRYPIWARTRAGMMFERLAIRLQENFAGDPGVRFVFATETVKVIFDEKLMIRCKKADGQGLGHNIPTGANDMFCEQGAFPGFEPLEKVEVVYVLNAYSTAIKRIMVQARDGDVRLWAYEIDDTALPAAAPIAPFPTPSAPSPDISMLVQPRTQPVSKDETDKK
jgi:hypothetical protein